MEIGIIGAGKQAPKHISGLINRDDVSLIYIADLYEEAAAKLAGQYESKVKSCSIDEVFNNPDIKGVIISTPTPSHHDLCLRSIRSKKPFLVEKPLASSLDKAREILSESVAHKTHGMVGFIYRFSPIFATMNDLLKNGETLGDSSHAFFRIAGQGSHQEWKHTASKDGGAISEMMVHMIDLAVWYFGKATNIALLDNDIMLQERIINGNAFQCDAEDWSIARLDMENGVRVLIQADMSSPAFKQYAEINCSNGIIEGSIQPHYQDAITLKEARAGYDRGYQPLDTPKANLYISQGECFMNMILSGSKPERCSLEDAVEVMRIQSQLKSAAE